MSRSHSSKRILVVGREVGPFTRLLKISCPKALIGAVDVLGNEETRFYTDWKFSVEKQVPNSSILRPKHRSMLELLYELARVMLEDLEFDLLIPLAPFHTKPEYLLQLSQDVQVLNPNNNESLKQVATAYSFIRKLSVSFPEKIPDPISFSSLSEFPSKKFPLIFISDKKSYLLSSKKNLTSCKLSTEIGFLIPFFQVHCGFFISSFNSVFLLGLQTLSPPYNHQIFVNNLEKNAFLPFSQPPSLSFKEITEILSKFIKSLDILGIIIVYFGIEEDHIFPFSCCPLPDENFDLWQSRSSQSLIQVLFSEIEKNSSLSPSSNCAFKLPIYSQHALTVPPISKILASQRNLPGVISHPDYPICSISGSAASSLEAYSLLRQKQNEIVKILFPKE
ncbi:MAG: hypothetical protein JSV04_07680 [Candidatus Heimdallarchaeota archaeon]|nr:MAG: hypothetical protein JSV04_07680 [Candidatus Heimdallarchaeota archaeon]